MCVVPCQRACRDLPACRVPCQRATDLPRLATLRRWAIAASFAPLDIHEYVFGGESCNAGLICVRLLVVSRQIGRAWHLWRCSSSASGVESRSRSSGSGSRRWRGDPRRRGLPWLRSGFARLAPRLRQRRPTLARLAQLDISAIRSLLTRFLFLSRPYPRQQRKKASSTREEGRVSS